jgi:hypothetical protein
MDKNENNNELSGDSIDTHSALEYSINRYVMISYTAYFRAEKRGFAPNNELEDWLEAEREIQRHLDSFSS